MPKPLCIYCGKQVQDYKALMHSVRWNNGGYAHSRCYTRALSRRLDGLSSKIDDITGRRGGK